MPSANANSTAIAGYGLGELSGGGALIVELWAPSIPLPVFMNLQNGDRIFMDRRPGMQIKYLPYRYDEASPNLHTGGSYMFDTFGDAKEYKRWAGDEFQVGDPKIPFFQQFLSHRAWVFQVVGGHNFAKVDDHAVDRVQLWNVQTEQDQTELLKTAYPKLTVAAQAAGATSVWLLYNPDEKTVGIHTTFLSAGGIGGSQSVRDSLAHARKTRSLEQVLPADLVLTPVFDRTSAILTSWLPKSRSAGGVETHEPFTTLLAEAAAAAQHNGH